eukprot:SAG11_NODE_13995_length_629_cov_1.262264_2_plen_77_part_00
MRFWYRFSFLDELETVVVVFTAGQQVLKSRYIDFMGKTSPKIYARIVKTKFYTVDTGVQFVQLYGGSAGFYCVIDL